jgi:hypothetical protein
MFPKVLPRDELGPGVHLRDDDHQYAVNPDPGAAGMLSVNPDAKRGPRKTLTGVPCRTGIAWSFDAANGEFLWAKSTVEQNLVAKVDGKGLVTVNENVVLYQLLAHSGDRRRVLFNGGMDSYQTRLASQAMGYTVTYSIGGRHTSPFRRAADSTPAHCK